MNDLWSVWELMGDSNGMSRGRMRDAIVAAERPGWELVDAVASVGSSGWWPHSMAFWKIADDDALGAALEMGVDDGLDEAASMWGKSKLYQHVRGEFGTGALLLEYVRAESPQALEQLEGPDLVLQEVFAPWQGLTLWSADDISSLAERQRADIGSHSKSGMVEVTGWWVITTPDRELV